MATVKKGAKKGGAAKAKPGAKTPPRGKPEAKLAKPAAKKARGAAPRKKGAVQRPAADAAQLSRGAQGAHDAQGAPAGGRKTFVLIVDDFADAREMYAEYFEFLNYRVSTAENGQEAIEKATAERPDVILMDLSLPVLDGWEATRRLKRDDRTRHIPVIALTGNALAGHEEHARKAGCDSFLTKPCLPEDVEREIQKILSVSRRSVA